MIMPMAGLLVILPNYWRAPGWVAKILLYEFMQVHAGGTEMAAPNWGIFMSKVYADKKLGYGKLTAFEKPAAMNNEELSADTDWGKIFKQGDSTAVDEGNGDAGDFITDPMIDNTPVENIKIESEIPKAAADTNKNKSGNKDKQTPPALKPVVDDKTKKPAEKPKAAEQ